MAAVEDPDLALARDRRVDAPQEVVGELDRRGLPRAAPLIDGAFCLLHDPAKAQEAGEARRLGGFRRRREGTIVVAYDLESLGTVEGIVRVLDIALRDVLGLDNSVPRNRVLIGVAQAAARLLQVGDLAARVASPSKGLVRPTCR